MGEEWNTELESIKGWLGVRATRTMRVWVWMDGWMDVKYRQSGICSRYGLGLVLLASAIKPTVCSCEI